MIPTVAWVALVVAISGVGASDHREIENRLSATPVTCHVLKDWGKAEGGEPWFMFSISCNLPAATEALVAGQDPSKLVTILEDPDARFSAVAALAALGKLRELPAVERVRFVLELARREKEPFASSSIGFVFGEAPWWEGEVANHRALNQHLGDLAMPWERSMTPMIRQYLFRDQEKGPASTLAVYLCVQLGSELDPEILQDLEKVTRQEPDSLAGKMARDVLDTFQTSP